MYRNNPAPPPKKTGSLTTWKVGVLLRELSKDEDKDEDKIPAVGDVSSGWHVPWRTDFHSYLNSRDQLGVMTIVEWWGVHTQNGFHTCADLLWSQWNADWYPVWAALAQDYLPVMASSVSSKHVFSSAGITISRRRSQLKPDIVEALQFMKCIYRRELLFHQALSSVLEAEESFEGTGDAVREEGGAGEKGWDDFVGDLQDDGEFQGVDSNDVFIQAIM